ncbi:MAG: prepilin-type N-terminal cleavage/methylation domain-containing protein [Verrucomicrobiaceae bacterium]|nr:MAG: prepilin-type N-terminal cleavage/methylation domain-containing protein [Verrucomicrobiaceae bacterium]
MRSLHSDHRISSRHRGFTLVEVSVAAALLGVVGVIMFGVLRSGMILSKQNAGLNLSSLRARQTIDRIGEQARYSIDQPILINSNGGAESGSTSNGVLVKRYIGGPYVIKETQGGSADIATTATQFVLEFRKDLSPPVVGDWILMETVTRPELEISAAAKIDQTEKIQRWRITTRTAINEAVRPGVYRVSGQLYRKEAFMFVATETGTNPRSELRHFARVVAATNFLQAANYRVLASGFRRIESTYFKRELKDGVNVITLSALVHSSGQDEYLDKNMQTTQFTTVPVRMQLRSVNQ